MKLSNWLAPILFCYIPLILLIVPTINASTKPTMQIFNDSMYETMKFENNLTSNITTDMGLKDVLTELAFNIGARAFDAFPKNKLDENITIVLVELSFTRCPKIGIEQFKTYVKLIDETNDGPPAMLRAKDFRKYQRIYYSLFVGTGSCDAMITIWCKYWPSSAFVSRKRKDASRKINLHAKILCPPTY